jgi:4-hydroxy-tetrahydrodipicolinate synthase
MPQFTGMVSEAQRPGLWLLDDSSGRGLQSGGRLSRESVACPRGALIKFTKSVSSRRTCHEGGIMAPGTKFRGSFTALVTPFKEGAVDEKAFRGLIAWQISEGTNGLVPVGTTGESPTLSHAEHRQVVEWCIDEARGRVPVIAGSGSNSTAEAIELAQHAEAAGVDAVLVVTPYYNKPTQEGLYQHFKAINDAIGIPIIIYNIPARSVIDMSVDTMKRLYELRNIAGVKDATANIVRLSQQRAALGPDFNQMSGEDATALGFMAHGGHGCISVTSNVAPRLCAELQAACLRGDYVAALKLHDKLMPLHLNLFIETNPAPAKFALSVLGKCAEAVRLPMVTLSDKSKSAVRDAMVHAGLIN